MLLESVFFLLLLTALGLVVFAFVKHNPQALLLASIMFFASGLLLLDTSATSGIERDEGFIVRSIGDDNFVVDLNKSYRNAGNDTGLLLLGNLFVWGSVAGMMMSIAFLIQPHLSERFK